MTRDEAFDLIAAQLEMEKAMMRAALDRDLFRADIGPAPSPLTWRQRVRLRRQRVTRYLATVWDALRGRDPYQEYD